MRPAHVPETLIDEDRRRITITAPDDLTHSVDGCEGLLTRGPDGLAQIHVRIELEPGDLRRIRATGELWVTFLGGVTPFRLSVEPPGQED